MSTVPPAAPAPAERHLRKRVVIPSLIGVLLLIALAVAVVRGTWADRETRNPSSSAEGPLTQLYQTPDGHKQARCALVIDRPIERVWAVVTDYDHFAAIFPMVASASAERAPDGRYRLTGVATSPLGSWEFTAHVRHDELPIQKVASWDEPSGRLTVNRGSWTLTLLGADRTLLVYALEVEVPPYPAFVVRNVLLSRVDGAVRAVARRATGGGD